jgi:hypothetical protein
MMDRALNLSEREQRVTGNRWQKHSADGGMQALRRVHHHGPRGIRLFRAVGCSRLGCERDGQMRLRYGVMFFQGAASIAVFTKFPFDLGTAQRVRSRRRIQSPVKSIEAIEP